ncbi:hypoxanthine phosphoribosyltransferase [Corallococcus sp. H22C18031201]|uniref:hypoxanthine phosphoribosyltransferase n=1 Tax=Citreicoccus inhibens TaxID=2849499 RepID=UPI000E71482B|nr:hypoxanthine phosphoribosyltransferase [Citreicoccus inhibens]MBJ6761980.1 hypoxanthine phosphoribosyltransferase [Myxococcaceae bacterium JPH2]MBU8899739.1 hypoxanthine phosphoribosyltransferase [Citreicoccus inhibens]RJS19199.1 hypoxanthine phosphoribosyltransferase [Corallococcus sp. H22C18031201]
MTFHQKDVDVLISEEKLHARIKELGAAITRDYQGKELTLVCVLKGSVFFATDLARAIDLPLTLEFLGVSSYQGGTESTGEVRITTDVSKPMAGKHLLVIEDIIDTGLTMSFLMENLAARHPASLKLCSLLEKPARARTQVNIDYKGFVIDDHFVVGYGLDYGEKYRNINFIGVWKGK